LAQRHHILVSAASFWFKTAKRTKSEIKKCQEMSGKHLFYFAKQQACTDGHISVKKK
jgi:hypothetical protein